MKIIKELDSLSIEELREIKNRCDYLIIRLSNKDPNHYIWFYDFIKNRLLEKYQLKYPPYSVYKKTSEFKYFKECSDYLLDFYKDVSINKRFTKVKLCKFFDLYFKLMSNYLDQYNVPISLSTMCKIHKKFNNQLQKNFPGYLSAGLGYFILK